jgi:hypothetical protein
MVRRAVSPVHPDSILHGPLGGAQVPREMQQTAAQCGMALREVRIQLQGFFRIGPALTLGFLRDRSPAC